jgi:P-type conjugative transfer protein TrbL
MTPTDILSAYVAVGQHYADLTRPYALHLLYLLMTVEMVTIGITYMMGSDDIPELGWRILRLVFSGGFAYWWLINNWWIAMTVLGSFNQLGQNITGLPELTPSGFIANGTSIAHVLWNAPSAAHYLPDIPLALGKLLVAVLILVILVTIAAIVIFTLAVAYLIIGPGSILVALLPNRFTAPISEGYFNWLIRTGVMLLFFFVVLGAAQSFANQWNVQLTTVCAPGADGACTAAIPVETLLDLLGDTIVLAFICIGVPFTAAHIVGGGVNMALEHFAAAKYLAAGGGRKVAAAVSGLSQQISRATNSNNQRTTLQQRIAAGGAAASSVSASKQTAPLPRTNAYGVQRTQNLPAANGGKPTTQI